MIHPGKPLTATEDYLNGRHGLGPTLWATVATDRWLSGQAGNTREGS